MSAPEILVVHLRQPRRDANEARDDPFWEFGSFGCTGCHGRNLMHRDKGHRLHGRRLAFAQGGRGVFRLVLLSPPVVVVQHERVIEATWKPASMPFRFASAPLLVDNDGRTDFPLLRRALRASLRTTWCGAFSSAFRSRCAPLPSAVATEVAAVYDRAYSKAATGALAMSYEEALPHHPPRVDRVRRASYETFLARAGSNGPRRGACRSRSDPPSGPRAC